MRRIFSTVFGPHEPGLDRRVVGHQRDRPAADRAHAGDDAVGAEAVLLPVGEQRLLGERARRRAAARRARAPAACPARAAFSRWRSGPPAQRARRSRSPSVARVSRLSSCRVRDRRLARVVVEAHARLAAVPAGARASCAASAAGRSAARGTRRTCTSQIDAERVEADEVGERQRPHRVPGAGLHRRRRSPRSSRRPPRRRGSRRACRARAGG